MAFFGRGPRWASVNLGIFVCIQCSGIHRSLGVHISKVRSVTLDTWLPEQVEFISGMGNVKANTFWEADLPQSYKRPSENDHVGLENFIRAKYEAKRWIKGAGNSSVSQERRVPRDDVRVRRFSQEDRPSNHRSPEPAHFDGPTVRQYKSSPNGGAESSSLRGDHVHGAPVEATSATLQEALGSRPAVIKATQHAASASEPSSLPAPQKVEGTKDLFDLLSLESDSNTATNDNEWAAFQCQCVLLISCPLTRCLNSASLDGVQAENLHALQQGHLSIGSWRFGILNSRFKNLSNIYSFWENMFSSHTHSRSTHKLIASKRCSCHLLFGVF
jgi:hypothetical protein